ncbi:MAG: hypothetical protein H6667_12015 [Ardenticatenaceae bacterium]|nr:hypothetical protein [Ardenticatenaceae bacterium]
MKKNAAATSGDIVENAAMITLQGRQAGGIDAAPLDGDATANAAVGQ